MQEYYAETIRWLVRMMLADHYSIRIMNAQEETVFLARHGEVTSPLPFDEEQFWGKICGTE